MSRVTNKILRDMGSRQIFEGVLFFNRKDAEKRKGRKGNLSPLRQSANKFASLCSLGRLPTAGRQRAVLRTWGTNHVILRVSRCQSAIRRRNRPAVGCLPWLPQLQTCRRTAPCGFRSHLILTRLPVSVMMVLGVHGPVGTWRGAESGETG